ncbi:HAD hydrolase-like protein [Staphylococcus pseudintermedius]
MTDELNIRPEETLMVGDSWTNDVKGSINVGMFCDLVQSSQTEDRHLDNHQIQIFTGEIEQLLEKLISMMEADCHF